MVDSLDSGSSAHSGHAGSSPASRTKETVERLSLFLLGSGRAELQSQLLQKPDKYRVLQGFLRRFWGSPSTSGQPVDNILYILCFYVCYDESLQKKKTLYDKDILKTHPTFQFVTCKYVEA